MKKILIITLILSMIMLPTLVMADHDKSDKKGLPVFDDPNIGFLLLHEKNYNWEVVDKGAWGEMTYNIEGPTFDVTFNGYDLESNTEYSLIYYPYSFPEMGGLLPDSTILGEGITSKQGDIYIENSVNMWHSLPRFFDKDGAKIWLVPSSDIKGSIPNATMTTYYNSEEFETYTLEVGESITSLHLIELLDVDINGVQVWLKIDGTSYVITGLTECASPTTNTQICLNSAETGLPITTNPTEYLFNDNLITYTKTE